MLSWRHAICKMKRQWTLRPGPPEVQSPMFTLWNAFLSLTVTPFSQNKHAQRVSQLSTFPTDESRYEYQASTGHPNMSFTPTVKYTNMAGAGTSEMKATVVTLNVGSWNLVWQNVRKRVPFAKVKCKSTIGLLTMNHWGSVKQLKDMARKPCINKD